MDAVGQRYVPGSPGVFVLSLGLGVCCTSGAFPGFFQVGSPAVVAASGPCGGPLGGGSKFAALVAWLCSPGLLPAITLGSSLSLASSNLMLP